MPTEYDKIYIAGFFDGEGCINLRWYQGMQYNRHGNLREVSHRLVGIQIANTNKAVLEYIESVFGGSVHDKKEHRPNAKPSYRWRLDGPRKVQPFLESIAPYVRVKRPIVTLALAFCQTNQSEVARQIAQDAHVLNQRGIVTIAQLHLTPTVLIAQSSERVILD